jgi:hypothetical protein
VFELKAGTLYPLLHGLEGINFWKYDNASTQITCGKRYVWLRDD